MLIAGYVTIYGKLDLNCLFRLFFYCFTTETVPQMQLQTINCTVLTRKVS